MEQDPMIAAIAAELWQGFTAKERTMVRFGMFPAEKMHQAEQRIGKTRDTGRLLAVALMDCAKADGGMRA